jgi:hypothetical protein
MVVVVGLADCLLCGLLAKSPHEFHPSTHVTLPARNPMSRGPRRAVAGH